MEYKVKIELTTNTDRMRITIKRGTEGDAYLMRDKLIESVREAMNNPSGIVEIDNKYLIRGTSIETFKVSVKEIEEVPEEDTDEETMDNEAYNGIMQKMAEYASLFDAMQNQNAPGLVGPKVIPQAPANNRVSAFQSSRGLADDILESIRRQ